MFESDFLERFSRIHPATPFVVWIPVAALFLVRSALRHDLGGPRPSRRLFLVGMFAWTLRRVRAPPLRLSLDERHAVGQAHPLPPPRRAPRLPERQGPARDAAADEHRRSRSSSTRSSRSRSGARVGEPFFAGFVVGYLFYDGTHYSVHHFVPTTRWGKFLRRHHMTHHYADHDGGFGVSSPLWDLVFRTMPAKRSSGWALRAGALHAPADADRPGMLHE